MRVRLLLAGLVVVAFAGSAMAAPPSQLHVQVFTSPPEGIAVNSTLVYGDKDAILIDAQFRLSDAHRVVAAILESKKNLTTVYVTHPHPDHYFGLVVIRQAFPNAKFVALPRVVEGIKASWQNRVNAWKPQYGDNIPSNPIIPDALEGNTLTLEGETLQVFGPLQGDSAGDNSFVWIPSLKAIVGGDTLFSGAHFVFAPMSPLRRKIGWPPLNRWRAQAGNRDSRASDCRRAERRIGSRVHEEVHAGFRRSASVVQDRGRIQIQDESAVSESRPRRTAEYQRPGRFPREEAGWQLTRRTPATADNPA